MNNCFETFRPVRPSLAEAFEKVKVQICYEDFEEINFRGKKTVPGLVRDICLMIAAEYAKNPESHKSEVYGLLTNEHIEYVAENFKKQINLVKKKKAYLETALYNVVFEYNAHLENEGL